MIESVSPSGEWVAIGMGSNRGAPLANLSLGLCALRRLLEDVRASSVYETAPVHHTDQPTFLNVCCVGRTYLHPRLLLTKLQQIEALAGRVRQGPRYGPRTLDMDLLLYGMQVIHGRDLVVPHPRLRERAFVLIPLREIAPDWRVPGDDVAPEASVADLADVIGGEGVVRTDFLLEDL